MSSGKPTEVRQSPGAAVINDTTWGALNTGGLVLAQFRRPELQIKVLMRPQSLLEALGENPSRLFQLLGVSAIPGALAL